MGFITVHSVHIKGVNTKRQIRLCSTAVSADKRMMFCPTIKKVTRVTRMTGYIPFVWKIK